MSSRAPCVSGFWVGPRVQPRQGNISPGPAVLETGLEVMAGCLMGEGSGLRHGRVWPARWAGKQLSERTRAGGPSAGLTWNFFLATKYCMRRMTLMVARWCSRSLRWRREGRGRSSRACPCQRPAAVRGLQAARASPGSRLGPSRSTEDAQPLRMGICKPPSCWQEERLMLRGF